jgi:hypothetical protein
MAGPRIIYSFAFTRELNLHRSKEQLEKEFSSLEDHTSEFAEFVSRMHKDLMKHLAHFGGMKTVDIPETLYVVLRDRGLSFPEPLTVVFDENQKLMFARYVNLVAQRTFEKPEAAALLTKYVMTKLPMNFDREVAELFAEQHIMIPLTYDLNEKPLKKWLK